MAFLNPILAFSALACVLAPVIIHLLFRRKRRPVEWGAMRFVMEAFRRHRKRLQLEQILLLIVRTLAVLLLAFAVGRPMFAGNTPLEARRPRDLVILIDNSIASQVKAGTTSEFESHKQAAIKLLDELDTTRGDRVAVIALGSPSERLVAPPTSEFGSVRSTIEQLEPTDGACDLPGASALIRDVLSKDDKRDNLVALLSSFRTGSIDLQNESNRPGTSNQTEPAHEHSLGLLASPPASDPANNVSIVGIEPLRSILLRSGENAQTQQARVQLKRSGPDIGSSALVTLRLRAATPHDVPDEQAWTKSEARFMPGQESASVLASIAVPKSRDDSSLSNILWIEGRIDDDAIAADNVFRRPWKSREQIRIAIVAPQSPADSGSGPDSYSAADWFTLALSPAAATRGVGLENETDPIRVTRVDPGHFTAQDLTGIDAVFVTRPDLLESSMWPLLGDFARKGGLLVVTPAPQEGAQLWADSFTKASGLSWSFSRESQTILPPAMLRGANADQPVLSSLSAELTELIKPVIVSRILGVELKGDGAILLAIDAQHPFLIESRPGNLGKGLVVAFLVSPQLSWTNLPAMPLMVPLVQEIVRQGVGLASGTGNLIAGATLEDPDELRAIEPPGNNAVDPVARKAGLWRRIDSRGTTRDLVAVNADTQAATTSTQTKEQLAPYLKSWLNSRDVAWMDSPSASTPDKRNLLSQNRKTPPIDLPLLIAGLLLLVADTFLSRWFSHASTSGNLASAPGSATSDSTPSDSQPARGAAA